MPAGDDAVYLGLDVGGTNVKYGLVDSAGAVIWSSRAATPIHRPLPVDAIHDVAVNALERATRDGHLVVGIGIATPGRVDPTSGVVLDASNLQWKEMALGRALESKLELPVRVINDTNAAAIGEFGQLPDGTRTGDLMCISIGTGVGAGLILGGRLYSGPRFAAGELGHVVADPHGRECICGGRGCLETIAAGPGIVRAFREAAASDDGESVTSDLTLQDVAAAALAGRPAAVAALSAAATVLGIQVANCFSLLDVSHFVIGGGVANIEWPLVSRIRQAAITFMAPAKSPRLQVHKSRMIDRAAIVGAVMVLRESVYV